MVILASPMKACSNLNEPGLPLMKKNKLTRLRHHEIDKAKWDAGIARSTHPLIYAESWYLDIVAPQWEALVSNDYNTLWPLTLNRKFKWPVIMQPMFTQQLGIFSSAPVDKETMAQLYSANPYPIITLQSHSAYEWPGALKSIIKSNSILSLHDDYAKLTKAFRKGRKQSLKKALKEQKNFDYQASSDTFIAFTRQNINYQLPPKHLMLLHQIISQALERKHGFILSVTDEFEEPLSMAFFLNKYNRITNLAGHSSSKGYAKEGMFLILNQVIQDFSASEHVLDFEGSELEGIASFYRSFGAVKEPYYYLQNPLLSHLQKIRKRLSKKNS